MRGQKQQQQQLLEDFSNILRGDKQTEYNNNKKVNNLRIYDVDAHVVDSR